MTAVVIAGDLSGRERATRNHILSRPSRHRQPHSDHAGHWPHRCDLVAIDFARVIRGMLVDGLAGFSRSNHGQHAPLNSCRPFKASGSLIPGPARVQPSKQSPRRFADPFHVKRSFPNASAFHEHLAIGARDACSENLSLRISK